MQQFNTLNDLIYFAYNESDLSDADDYHSAINADQQLSRDYKAVLQVKHYLKKIKVGPSESVIKNLMNYSRALSVSKSKNAGNISLLLN
ncbi:MAG: hypothetical protein ACOCX8_00685 [Bacteroidota bacterium]